MFNLGRISVLYWEDGDVLDNCQWHGLGDKTCPTTEGMKRDPPPTSSQRSRVRVVRKMCFRKPFSNAINVSELSSRSPYKTARREPINIRPTNTCPMWRGFPDKVRCESCPQTMCYNLKPAECTDFFVTYEGMEARYGSFMPKFP